jgi:hypothetical protein
VLTLAVGAPARAAAPADSAGRGWSEQPRAVMLRSLLVPGWGQAHNRAWFKAALIGGAEAALGWAVVGDQRELGRLRDRVEGLEGAGDAAAYTTAVNEYNARLDDSVGRQWLLAFVVGYALVDAYVDAHFRGFDIEFQHDPALPEGVPPARPTAPAGRPEGARTRLALRWTF